MSTLFTVYGDPAVMRYASDPPFTDLVMMSYLLDSIDEFLLKALALEWAIVEKCSETVIGTCGLHSFKAEQSSAEVGILLAQAHWGKGYAQEVINTLAQYAQDDLALQSLQADIHPANTRSIRLFEYLGFQPIADTPTLYELKLAHDPTPYPNA